MKKILFQSIIVLFAFSSCKTEAFLMQKYTRYVHSLKCPAKEKKCDQVSQGPSFLNCSNCGQLGTNDSCAAIITAENTRSYAGPLSNNIGAHTKSVKQTSDPSGGIRKMAPQMGAFGKELIKKQYNQIGKEQQKGIFGFLNTIFKIILFVVILAVICAVIVLVIVIP
ncbi:MAG: hypothetical protein JNL60_19245 [Bacteroidia bacterium]|nr:hypothetical protein [Bacteroidia bacterium]